MSQSRPAAAATVLICLSLALAGCSGQSTQQSPANVLHARLIALLPVRWLVLDGTVSMQGVTYPVTLNEDDQSGANGSVTVAQKSVAVTWTGGQLFLRSAEYFDAQNVYTGDRWTLTKSDKLASLVGALVNRKSFVGALTAMGGANVSLRSGPTIKGVPTTQLVSDTMSVTVPTVGGPPIRIATALDEPLSDGLSDLKLDLATSSAPLAVTPPPVFVDLANKNSLPADFEEAVGPPDPFQWDPCDARGCTVSDLFRNAGGRLATATATFAIQKGGTQLGTCGVMIPTTDNGGTVRVGCRVNYDTSASVQGSVDIENPA